MHTFLPFHCRGRHRRRVLAAHCHLKIKQAQAVYLKQKTAFVNCEVYVMRLLVFLAVTALVVIYSQAARPRFSSLKNVYPTYSRYPRDGQKLKRDMGLPSWLFANGTPNTCAIRMSKAFHDAGLGINRSRVTRCGTSSARVSGKGRQYIIRVKFFKCYLAAIWGGSPNVRGISSKSTIRNQKGLLIFTGCSGFGQHIDLWDGSRCSMGCEYFNRCSTIEMYTLQ